MSIRSVFFFQAEDGIRDLVRSRGLGDVYKRQVDTQSRGESLQGAAHVPIGNGQVAIGIERGHVVVCLLYTSDAADDLPCVVLGGRRILKKQKTCFSLT